MKAGVKLVALNHQGMITEKKKDNDACVVVLDYLASLFTT
jgi:hypothetical protein